MAIVVDHVVSGNWYWIRVNWWALQGLLLNCEPGSHDFVYGRICELRVAIGGTGNTATAVSLFCFRVLCITLRCQRSSLPLLYAHSCDTHIFGCRNVEMSKCRPGE